MGLVAAGIAVGGAALAGTGASIAGSLSKAGNVPGYTPVDLQAEQNKAIAGNIGALEQAKKLGVSVDTFNTTEIGRMLRTAMPYYDEISGKVVKNITSMLSGELPGDVSGAIQRSGAARALAGGYGGTGMHHDLVARDLGLTSLQLTQQGLSSAESWLNTASRLTIPGQFNVASMFVNPMASADFNANQSVASYNSAMSAWGQPNELQIAGYGLNQLAGATVGFMGATGMFNSSPPPAGTASNFSQITNSPSLASTQNGGWTFPMSY